MERIVWSLTPWKSMLPGESKNSWCMICLLFLRQSVCCEDVADLHVASILLLSVCHLISSLLRFDSIRCAGRSFNKARSG